MKQKIVIIGAGMAGCFQALCLAQIGYDIELYETHPDIRKHPLKSDRSFNLTIYYRGIQALKEIGIWDSIMPHAVLLTGNVVHTKGKKLSYDPFEADGKNVLYTIHRNSLNILLLNELEKYKNIKIHFHHRLLSIDRKRSLLYLLNTISDSVIQVPSPVIIGADGVNSTVRPQIHKSIPSVTRQEYLTWGYKEVFIPEHLVQTLLLNKQATHTWSLPHALVIAFPNTDGSATLMFTLPLTGSMGFDQLQSESKIHEYMSEYFPDLLPVLSNITESFLTKPTGKFITIYTSPWYYKDSIVLIGDAAHGVVPFYGQGMCAAFEDCLFLKTCMENNPDNLEQAFQSYETARKKHTDVLADLSKQNFTELRDNSRSHLFLAQEKIDTALNRFFPSFWLPPLYKLIAHDTYDYADAFEKHAKQRKRGNLLGLGVVAGILSIWLYFTSLNTEKKK